MRSSSCRMLGNRRRCLQFTLISFVVAFLRLPSTPDAFTTNHNVHSRRPPKQQRIISLQMSSDSSDNNNNNVSQLIQIGRQTFEHNFRFPLDDWQLEAGGAICEGYNVIVCAPTGAGKTVVGEMALLYAYHNVEQNGIYTTPLKALSNQKYSELCQTFGRTDTGLSTGDISINKGARITVMTTEVYRNIAWRSSTPTATIMGTNELTTNAVVVLDEFHYMGHPGRGGVWEESIITSPPHTQIISLSATLSNAQALASWMEYVTNRKTILVEVPNQKRPVPLRYLFANKEGLFPLFRDPDAGPGAPKGLLGYRGEGMPPKSEEKKETKKGFQGKREESKPKAKLPRGLQVNPALRAAAEKRLQKVNRSIERQKVRTHLRLQDDEDEWGGGGRSRRAPPGPRRMSPREERKERERLLRNEMRRAVPSLSALVNRLRQKDLLPAIFFIFSRAGCDSAARSVFQVMKGPRDPNRLLQDEVDDFGDAEKPRQGKKRKTRQRGRRQGNLLEDSDGRTFRPSSNYISEDVLTSLMEAAEPMDEDQFDESSPLSSDNWDFYTKAGLLNYKEVRELASRISVFNEENPEIAFEDEIIEQYMYGVGSHHAGMLPAHKSFVEILYKLQLMKVVFATETLAAGINMPARTTVICALAKRGDGSSINLLETSNLLQMAGRAGRRGMDTEGTCVIVATPFESSDDAAKILTDPIKPITSQFSPSYSLAINLVARGEGKLDVARQLVSKSFAMWEKSQVEENIAAAVENHGEAVSEVLQVSAQERFMNTLVDILQDQVDQRRAEFDIARLESLLGVLTDRESLKKTSKSYLGATKMLEVEQTTLGYLETELATMRALSLVEEKELDDIVEEDEKDLLEQIEIQRKRTAKTEKEVNKHPFSVIATIANEIMAESSPVAILLRDALKSAREGKDDISSMELQATELSTYSKSTISVQRKMRKLATSNPELDSETLIELQADNKAKVVRDDSWDDMLSITRVLVAYGCLSVDGPVNDKTDYESQIYTVTAAGVNIGMLGFENSLWALVSMGGACDVIGVSSELDKFRKAMRSLEDDWYDEDEDMTSDSSIEEMPKAQQEAEELVNLLRSMTPSELAGYVSSIVSENSRGSAPSVVELFQRLTPLQQRVIQSSLLVMERLMEVQKEYSVDESTRNCALDISNTEVVTAWAAGCSWSEALQISGTSPGDLARTLSRVLDAVRQLGNLPYVAIRRRGSSHDDVAVVSPGIHAEVRRLCREAAQAINRYPVKDPLAFETPVEDEEELEQDEEELEQDEEELEQDEGFDTDDDDD